MSRDQRRRLLRRLRESGFTIDAGAAAGDLMNGFPPRLYLAGWAELEAEALAEWNRTREAVMAAAEPGRRPWAYFWFDVPHGETIPGPARDANLAAGRLTIEEADRMAYQHTLHAFGRIAASRPGQTTADWLADPALIERSIALCGWNPFSPDAIARLRERHRPTPANKETR